MSAEGAEAVADIVKRAHLKELNLYMNDIGDAGILKVPSLGCPCVVLLLSVYNAAANAVQRISQLAVLMQVYLRAALLHHLQTYRMHGTHSYVSPSQDESHASCDRAHDTPVQCESRTGAQPGTCLDVIP